MFSALRVMRSDDVRREKNTKRKRTRIAVFQSPWTGVAPPIAIFFQMKARKHRAYSGLLFLIIWRQAVDWADGWMNERMNQDGWGVSEFPDLPKRKKKIVGKKKTK